MAYRDRDPLENVSQPSSDPKQSGLFHSLKRALRDFFLRRVSTKQ